MIRLLIADDHPVVREGLRRIVQEAPGLEVVGEVASGHELLERLPRVPADIVLLDVTMPGPGFLELLQRLRSEHPTVAVLVLSVHPEDQYAVRALRAGASGYLTKDHSPEELTEAIRRVYRGSKYVSPGLAERLASDLVAGARDVRHELLSNREYEVLCLLGSGAHRQGDLPLARSSAQDRQHLPHPGAGEDGSREQCRPGPLRRAPRTHHPVASRQRQSPLSAGG